MVDFGNPGDVFHMTQKDGVICWSARWSVLNANSAMILGYWRETLQNLLAGKMTVVDHGMLMPNTTNAAPIYLIIYQGPTTRGGCYAMGYTTGAGDETIEPFYGPFGPFDVPASGNAIGPTLWFHSGNDAADAFLLQLYGRGIPKWTEPDAALDIQPVSVRDAQIWPWKRG